MIYFIGGAPRVGKTQLAKKLSQKTGLSWISTDNLRESLPHLETIPKNHSILRYWIGWEDLEFTKSVFKPSIKEIIRRQNEESKEVAKLVKGFVESLTYNSRDFVIEGVALLPEFYDQAFLKKHKVKFVCVGNTDYDPFLEYSWKHGAEGDWLEDVDKKTFTKATRFFVQFSKLFKDQAKSHKFPYYEIRSPSFLQDIEEISKKITQNNP